MPHNVQDMLLTTFSDAATETLKAAVSIPEPSDLPFPTLHPIVTDKYHGIGKFEHTTAWVMFGIFVLSFLGFSFTLLRTPRTKRLLPYVFVALTFMCSATYFGVASGTGSTFIVARVVDHVVHHKQIFFIHWINWLLSTPIILFSLSALSGLSTLEMLVGIAAMDAGIASSVIGIFAYQGKWHHYALHHGYQWAFVAYWLVPAAFATWIFTVPARKIAYARSAPLSRLYTLLALYLFTLWTIVPLPITILTYYHPLIPAHLTPLLYGIIDILQTVVFGAGVLFGTAHTGVEVVLPAAWGGEEEGGVRGGGYVAVPAA